MNMLKPSTLLVLPRSAIFQEEFIKWHMALFDKNIESVTTILEQKKKKLTTCMNHNPSFSSADLLANECYESPKAANT